MAENETPPPVSQGPRVEEPVAGHDDFVRKGADMMYVPPSEPVTEPTPMPVNLAPAAPTDEPPGETPPAGSFE